MLKRSLPGFGMLPFLLSDLHLFFYFGCRLVSLSHLWLWSESQLSHMTKLLFFVCFLKMQLSVSVQNSALCWISHVIASKFTNSSLSCPELAGLCCRNPRLSCELCTCWNGPRTTPSVISNTVKIPATFICSIAFWLCELPPPPFHLFPFWQGRKTGFISIWITFLGSSFGETGTCTWRASLLPLQSLKAERRPWNLQGRKDENNWLLLPVWQLGRDRKLLSEKPGASMTDTHTTT